MSTLESGAYFGEVAVLFNAYRSATVECADYGMYGSIYKEDVDFILSVEPTLRKIMTKETVLY
jgi:CRP-like cAMP-binding protein